MKKNLLFIISDEHNPKIMGCAGDPVVQTPQLDRLAAHGTRFTAAYCNSPACVPARASLATGQYVQDLELWDNAHPYTGSPMSWHRLLRDAGYEVASIGKLHFRSTEDDNGFSEEIIPMHVVDGVGDLGDLVRDALIQRGGVAEMANQAGPGESSYTRYDRDIASRAKEWLQKRAQQPEKPWALFVSLVAPHFPLTVPANFFDHYYGSDKLPWPKQYAKDERPNHPYIRDYATSLAYDDHFDSPEKVRRALAGYYGLVSFLDERIGEIVDAVRDNGFAGNTNTIYSSDHGENLGARGLWGKTTMYEESVGVPMIVVGDDFAPGAVVQAPVSHVDLFPTIARWAGCETPEKLPGVALQTIVQQPEGRTAFAEFHGMGSRTASYMVRDQRYKYIYYAGYPAQLFDLVEDPEERVDIAGLPGSASTIDRLHAQLTAVCDPEEVNARAKSQQAQRVEQHGGREVILAKGDFSFSPAPGTPAVFDQGAAV